MGHNSPAPPPFRPSQGPTEVFKTKLHIFVACRVSTGAWETLCTTRRRGAAALSDMRLFARSLEMYTLLKAIAEGAPLDVQELQKLLAQIEKP